MIRGCMGCKICKGQGASPCSMLVMIWRAVMRDNAVERGRARLNALYRKHGFDPR